MKINFIITCYDKEKFWGPLQRILEGYRNIEASYCYCYNGPNDDEPRDLWIPNRGHQQGDMDLTKAGYDMLQNGVTRFIKIGIDSWLLDEEAIYRIFLDMEEKKCGYGGNIWHRNNPESLATDIIFADTRFGNVFEGLSLGSGLDFEGAMYRHCLNKKIKVHIIHGRVPVHDPDGIKDWNRLECEPLKWTMHHQLEKNLANQEKWSKCS